MDYPPNLDPEQHRVASAPRDARQIVIAGPGAGKSEVVGARCGHLLLDDVYPEEILVISFSHAAVGIVRSRTSSVVDEGRGIDPMTIDSLAARIREEVEDAEPVFKGYDASIRKATRLLEQAGEPLFPDIKHVVVDEVQDVVGIRARFVLALLEKGLEEGIGFTLLGDPMQSLYDFQLEDDRQWSSEQFLDEIRRRFAVEETHLGGEYRSRTEDARAVSAARQKLATLSDSERRLRLEHLARGLSPLGQVDEDLADDLRAWTGITALLTDTNARAGLVAAQLSEYGVPVELAASARDPSLAPWLGQLLGRCPTRTLDRDSFLDRAMSNGLSDAGSAWNSLVRVANSRRGLDLGDLAKGLRGRRYPLALMRTPISAVIASTVHRAKGLEFDNVVLVDPDRWRGAEDGASARRLFVAMSRARSRLSRCHGPSVRSWRKDARAGVWLEVAPRGRGTLGILMEPSLARVLGPVEHDLANMLGARVTWISAGELVTVDGDEVPSWIGTVDGFEVVRTGEEFGTLLRRLSFRGRVPVLRGGHVEGLETLVGSPGHSLAGEYGFWVGARVSGPISFEWE